MSFVPRIVTRNWRLKLSAFGLAVFLWAVVRADPSDTNTVTSVPVVVELSDLDWTLAGPPTPSSVDVRFAGSPRDFPRLGREDGPVVHVRVESVASTDTVIELERDWVAFSGRPGVLVQDISPSEVRLTFERTRAAAIPLFLRTTGELPRGVALAQPLALNPPTLRVQGPASRVEALDSIPLGPLDLGSVDRTDQYRVPIDTAGIGALTFSATQATVSVRLEQAVEQTFNGVPVALPEVEGLDDEALGVQPTTVDVTLRGGRTRVEQTDPTALRAVIPEEAVRDMEPGEIRTVPIHVRGVPELVRAFSTSDSVRVRLAAPPAPDTVADTMAVGATAAGPPGGSR